MCPDFKVENNDIDTEAIEQEIAKRIEERKAAGVYSHEVDSMVADRLPDEDTAGALTPLASLDYSATRAMSSWGVTTAYPVATEKRVIAPFIIFVKRIARLWARVAVGPIQREQTAFNRHAANALDALRKEAVARQAEQRAEDEDICELAGVLIDDEMSSWTVDTIAAETQSIRNFTVLCPCPDSLAGMLSEKGYQIYKIYSGSTWEETQKAVPGSEDSPAAFLENAKEETVEALLIGELSFMENPRILVKLLRLSYLALRKSGTAVILVQGLSAAGSSLWSAAPVVEKALEMAGFNNIRIVRPTGDLRNGEDSYIAFAVK